MSWVLADHEDPPMTADDLALLTHRLDRRSYLHDPFRSCSRRGGSGDRAATATMPPERRHIAHQGLAGPSATKQNTKRSRRDIRPLRAVPWIVLVACCSAVSDASAAPPALVHAAAERHPATSVPGAPARPEVYERRSDGWVQYWLWF